MAYSNQTANANLAADGKINLAADNRAGEQDLLSIQKAMTIGIMDH